jgi:hypothetical protein
MPGGVGDVGEGDGITSLSPLKVAHNSPEDITLIPRVEQFQMPNKFHVLLIQIKW